jgi:hypothetical protein
MFCVLTNQFLRITHTTNIHVIKTSLRACHIFFFGKKLIYEAGEGEHYGPHVKFSTRPHVKLTLGLILNFNVLCPEQSVYAYDT